MTLPYDVARCFQRSRDGLCGTCRRLEPSDSYRQSYILPQIVDGKCVNYIPPAGSAKGGDFKSGD